MKYTDFIIPVILILYSIFEYQRREQANKERMALLKQNIEPPLPKRVPTISTILLTTFIAILILGVIVLFFISVSKYHVRSIPIFLFPSGFLVVLFIFLILIIRRDIKTIIHKK
jgi:hypothetical protein